MSKSDHPVETVLTKSQLDVLGDFYLVPVESMRALRSYYKGLSGQLIRLPHEQTQDFTPMPAPLSPASPQYSCVLNRNCPGNHPSKYEVCGEET